MHLLKKGFVKKYLCWYTHGESYITYKTILEKMIDSIFISSNIHEFADDNSNTYRSMIMDVIRMDHNYSGEGSHNIHLHEEPNVDATRFFELLKYSNELLWDEW